jgi:hypothetical protein
VPKDTTHLMGSSTIYAISSSNLESENGERAVAVW